jgi:RND family efflux transporter MFP subunit
MKKKIIITAAVVALLAIIGLRLASNKKKINENNQVTDRSNIAIPVSTINAGMEDVTGEFILPAKVEPVNEADISINSSGKLKHLNIDLGTEVKKGQVLGSIDNSLKELNLQSTQLLVDKYERDYNNYKELYKGNAASENDYTNAKYNYENAKTQAAQIRQQIADGNLVAPVSGTIVRKNAEVGEFVNVGAVIATVVDVSKLKASVMVSEKDIYRLKKGMPVNILCDIYPGKVFKGTVRFISPQGDDSHNYQTEVNIENSSSSPIKAGTFVRVKFDLKSNDKTLLIPKAVLVEGVKNPYVYVVNGDRVATRKLVLGRETGEKIEVLDGLKTGETIVISGQINLTEGALINVINKQ